MIVLSAKDITKTYGVDVILDRISFHVNKGDHIGIVGANGAGKTTLLNILSGLLKADSGNYFLASGVTVGYLRQKDNFDQSGTLMEEVSKIFAPLKAMEEEMEILSTKIAAMAEKDPDSEEYVGILKRYGDMQEQFKERGGFSYKSEIKGILTSMSFGEEYYDKQLKTFSGGERTRLALACLLLEKPDILFLDEPTNHLDIGTLKWLEQYLKGYEGTVILVSHDRYFLNQMVNRIFEVQYHKLTCYDGNYSQYAEKKRQLREAQMHAYDKQQTEIRRQEDLIRRYKERGTEKLAKRAASREKRLDKVERIERPTAELGKMKIRFHQEYQSGQDVLSGQDLAKSFGYGADKKDLFSHVNFDIKRGERICIVGPNGVGKTTLLKVIMEQLAPSEGYLKIGHNVLFGYYDQTQQGLNDKLTVMDEIHDSYRLYTDGEIRNILGRFLFRGEQVFLNVGALSGGEKARLALLKLMMSGANVLILDEPTNHLDIDSKEVFEDALSEYPGTVIVVSHDRYFLSKIPTRILELSKDGFTEYLGKYDYYVEKKESIASGKQYLARLNTGSCPSESKTGDAARQRAEKKKADAEKRRLEREKAALEEKINKLEADIEAIQEKMCLPANLSNSGYLAELDQEQKQKQEKIDDAYEKWLNL